MASDLSNFIVKEDPYGELQLPVPPPPSTSQGSASRHPPPARKQHVSLPVSRVRTIMKTNVQSSQHSVNISQDSVLVLSRATELFISLLAKESGRTAREVNASSTDIMYNDLSSAVHKSEGRMSFLHDILPKKVLARDALATLKTDSNSVPQT